MNKQGYDLIGDTHGHADELSKLLQHLGYTLTPTGHSHEERKVIFLGDFIDRGEHLRQHKILLDIVMPMVENGHAYAVMGNHEFNALAYHTRHQGEYLRPHTAKNTHQHQAFLNEFDSDLDLKEAALNFFYSLPLWLELDGLRVIHACWDQSHIDHINAIVPNQRLTKDLLVTASTKGTRLFDAVETLLKGVEIKLPHNATFRDKDGHERDAVRVEWWKDKAGTLGEIALPKNISLGAAGKLPAPKGIPKYAPHLPPCFIGHYWLDGKPSPLSSNVACLDYSVAKEGKLVAYRWNGEQTLREESFTHA